jgi:hypothetical protein
MVKLDDRKTAEFTADGFILIIDTFYNAIENEEQELFDIKTWTKRVRSKNGSLLWSRGNPEYCDWSDHKSITKTDRDYYLWVFEKLIINGDRHN